MGIDLETASPEQRAQMEAKQAQEQRAAELEAADLEARIQEMRAKAARAQAAAAKDLAAADGQQYENRLTEAQTEKIFAEMSELTRQLREFNAQRNAQVDTDADAVRRFEAALPAIQEMQSLLS